MNALLACLNLQNTVLKAFVQSIDDEAGAMQQGHFKRLPGLIQHKNELTRQLADLDRERERLQHESRFQPASCTDQGLLAAWELLREQTLQAREGNRRNAVITHTLLNFTRQALSTLQGGAQPLYGSNGKHPGGAGATKTLGQG